VHITIDPIASPRPWRLARIACSVHSRIVGIIGRRESTRKKKEEKNKANSAQGSFMKLNLSLSLSFHTLRCFSESLNDCLSEPAITSPLRPYVLASNSAALSLQLLFPASCYTPKGDVG
jgi:hypothetical protein